MLNTPLLQIQRLVNGGWFAFTTSCADGMEALGIEELDVLDLVMTATACEVQAGYRGADARKNGRFRFEGDLRGRTIRVIVDRDISTEALFTSAHLIVEKGP